MEGAKNFFSISLNWFIIMQSQICQYRALDTFNSKELQGKNTVGYNTAQNINIGIKYTFPALTSVGSKKGVGASFQGTKHIYAGNYDIFWHQSIICPENKPYKFITAVTITCH